MSCSSPGDRLTRLRLMHWHCCDTTEENGALGPAEEINSQKSNPKFLYHQACTRESGHFGKACQAEGEDWPPLEYCRLFTSLRAFDYFIWGQNLHTAVQYWVQFVAVETIMSVPSSQCFTFVPSVLLPCRDLYFQYIKFHVNYIFLAKCNLFYETWVTF